jgi:hypothetical protein
LIQKTRTILILGRGEYDVNYGPVHPAYNQFFQLVFFSRNSIFLSQQISQQYFSVGLSAQPNGPYVVNFIIEGFLASKRQRAPFLDKG